MVNKTHFQHSLVILSLLLFILDILDGKSQEYMTNPNAINQIVALVNVINEAPANCTPCKNN